MLRSDTVLEQDVAAELACDALCCRAKIEVVVRNGIVTLSGTVPDTAAKTAVVRAVKRVYGVDGIDPRSEIACRPAAAPVDLVADGAA